MPELASSGRGPKAAAAAAGKQANSRADSKCGRGQFWRKRRRRRQQCRALSSRRIWSDGGADDCEADRSWPFVTLLIATVSGALFQQQQQHLTMTGCSCADHVPAETTVWCFSLFQRKQKERRGVFQRVRVFFVLPPPQPSHWITTAGNCSLLRQLRSKRKKDER